MDNWMLQSPKFGQSSSNNLRLSTYKFLPWGISRASNATFMSKKELTLRYNYYKIQKFSTSSSLSAISLATMAITFNTGGAEAGKRINRTGKNGFWSKVKDEVADCTWNVMDENTMATANKDLAQTRTWIMEGGKVEAEGKTRGRIVLRVSLSSKFRCTQNLTTSTDAFSNDYHQPCHPRCNRHCPQNPRTLRGPANRPPHGNHRANREVYTRRRPPRLVDNEDSSDERFFPAMRRQPEYSGRNPGPPRPTQNPRHSRRDRPIGMPQAAPDGGSRSGRQYPYGVDRQGPPGGPEYPPGGPDYPLGEGPDFPPGGPD